MLTLRKAHLIFMLFAIVGADLFGAWAVWRHATEGEPVVLALGIVAVLGGLGLIVYVARLVQRLDAAGIR